jgi:hypothetical protein
MIREVSIEEPSGQGKAARSTSVILDPLNEGLLARDKAVESPNTPEPTIRI